MSEIKQNRFCPRCGEYTGGNSPHCYACGARLSTGPKEEKSEPDILNIPRKKAKEPPRIKSSDTETDAGAHLRPAWYKVVSSAVFRGAAPAVISLVFILLSFCPLVGVRMQTPGGAEYTTDFSAVDMVVIGAACLTDYDIAELRETELYKLHRSYDRKAAGYMASERLTDIKAHAMSEYNKRAVRLDYMLSSSEPKINLVCAALAAAAYLALSGAVFVLSVASVIRRTAFKNRAERSGAGAIRILTVLVALLPAYLLLLVQACRIETLTPYMQRVDMLDCGKLFYILAIPVVLAVILAVYDKLICFSAKKVTHTDKMSLISLALAITASVGVFLSPISVSYAAELNGQVETETRYVDVADVCEYTYGEALRYTEASLENSLNIVRSSKNVVFGDEGYEHFAVYTLNTLCFSYGGDIGILYLFVSLLAFATLVSLLVLIISIIRGLTAGRLTGGKKPLYVLSVVFSVLYFGICTALVIIASTAMPAYMAYYVVLGIGPGPIVSMICAIVSSVIRGIQKPKCIEQAYDNPDVSYAPYVI